MQAAFPGNLRRARRDIVRRVGGFPTLPGAPAPVLVAFVAIFGALIGSFLNVVILRVPEHRSISYPGSHCPKCQSPIRWFDNLPVLSWLALRGRCRACKLPISARYPLIEALNSLLFVGLFWRFGITAATAVYFVFGATLVALTFIDVDHRIIPNVISLPGIVIGVALSFVVPHADGAWLPVSWKASLLGVLVGGGALFAVALAAEFIFRKEAMGMGDVKMLAMIGAFLGIGGVPFVFISSSLLGAIFGTVHLVFTGDRSLPYGPALAAGAVIYLFVGPEVVTAYLHHIAVLQSAH